ncbi:MAG: molybdopterin-binding/glycosyltransferase family 2 protein [Gammaproteobacteria bacterium]|nr:molybdopterin-binding/glycosyltransferase family 2 protein [Gammaproteobacteria bacterium]
MKFRRVDTATGAGAILAHGQSAAGKKFKKGRILCGDDIAQLLAAGVEELVVAQLDPSEVAEDEAATRLAARLVNENIVASKAFTGRVNLIARIGGVLTLHADIVHRVNLIDEAVTVATLEPWSLVSAEQMVATVKIIPFAVVHDTLQTVMAALDEHAGKVFDIAPIRHGSVGLIQTELPATRQNVLDKTRRITDQRIESIGGSVTQERRCEHSEKALVQELTSLHQQGCAPILITGASAIVDRRDVIPRAIELAGGEVIHYGMPVDPGNLLLLGQLGDCVVLGLPGCARSPAYNGLDKVLPRLMADIAVTPRDIMTMGVGGLLKEFAGRPQPRDDAVPHRDPVFAAVVLAAGSSRRMGPDNKLLAEVDGAPMLHGVLDAVTASAIRHCVVVTGFEAERVEECVARYEVALVHNSDYARGLSTSLKAGLASLPDEVDAALIVLGDMPDIDPPLLERLTRSFDPQQGREICVPVYNGKRGNPVLWSKRFFADLCAVQGDVGGRHLLGEFDEWVHECPVTDASIHRDIDTPEQLRARETDRN